MAGVPYCNYSIVDPKTLILNVKAPILGSSEKE